MVSVAGPAMATAKQHISLVVVGHVNAGKSTVAGHLIYQLGGVDKRSIDKFEEESESLGKSAVKYAWILDKLKAERERGLTIDISLWKVETQRSIFSIIDTPGHRDFIKNMITGTSQADAALLVVAASNDEFDAGMARDGQTREHTLLAHSMGVERIVVAVSKMDDPRVAYSHARFMEVAAEVRSCLSKVGYDAGRVAVVPVSGWGGDNLADGSAKMPWYHGPSLLAALEGLEPPPRPDDRPLRVTVKDVLKIGGVGVVPIGRVESGVMRPGDRVCFAPSAVLGVVKSIEMHHDALDRACPGDNVGFCVRNVSLKGIGRGFVCGSAERDPPRAAESFTARLVLLNHPGRITTGYTPVVDCHTSHVSCKITQLTARVDRHTGEMIEREPQSLTAGDTALVTMVPLKPMCVEEFAKYPPLGRFAVRDFRQTVAVGIILSVTKKELTIVKQIKTSNSNH